jgi:hypothetical protein
MNRELLRSSRNSYSIRGREHADVPRRVPSAEAEDSRSENTPAKRALERAAARSARYSSRLLEYM